MIVQNNDPYTQPSFSVSNRVLRAVWMLVWCSLFRYSPRPLHTWRAFLLRLFGAKVGRHVHVYPKVNVWAPWNLVVGDYVGIADGVELYNILPIWIGDRCVVSQRAYLCTGSHDIDSQNFQLVAKPIVLEPYVWVCAQAFVGPGVRLAQGAVIGAGAVLTKSVDVPWSVWAGNPARYVRARADNLMVRRG